MHCHFRMSAEFWISRHWAEYQLLHLCSLHNTICNILIVVCSQDCSMSQPQCVPQTKLRNIAAQKLTTLYKTCVIVLSLTVCCVTVFIAERVHSWLCHYIHSLMGITESPPAVVLGTHRHLVPIVCFDRHPSIECTLFRVSGTECLCTLHNAVSRWLCGAGDSAVLNVN